ncbi:MAG: ATP-dependent Clp protease proteolytic subunit [Chitinophagaceae bacterium]|nr:ATP-dependent Clp protease proteolytic subunit [Chitinophagaceae bacterium]
MIRSAKNITNRLMYRQTIGRVKKFTFYTNSRGGMVTNGMGITMIPCK